MVFSSVPVYLDPPNWQPQSNQQQGVTSHDHNPQLPPPPQPPSGGGGGVGGAGSIRPGSMADRARLAKVPQPETALKCPRCESTNTKFCYFNNYSLTQPRHFCKTCRRYWTRGGALRNVPVGGGCRRNKRSSKGRSSSRSKSPVVGDRQARSSSSTALASNSCATDIIGHIPPPVPQQLPILPPLHHLNDYNSGGIGLNFGGLIHHPPGSTNMEFQNNIGTNSSGGGSILSSGFIDQQWRLQQMQQFPFLTGLDPPAGLYPYDGEGVNEPPSNYIGQLRSSKPLDSEVVTQLAAVKMEDNHGLNMSRNFLGISAGNDQYWGGNAWTDLSAGFTSSSTSHLL